MPGITRNFSRRLLDGWHHLFGHPAADAPLPPVESAGLRAICHTRWPDDPAFAGAWDALCAAVPSATTFHSPTWQRAVIDARVKRDRLRLIVVWESDQLVGVLPLHAGPDGALETIAPTITDYLDPLIHPGRESDIWRIVLTLLARLRPDRSLDLTLHNVREDASCRTTLGALAGQATFDLTQRTTEACPRVALPATWDAFLAGLRPHTRKEVRRKLNKANTRGAARVVRCASDPAAITPALATAFALMERAAGAKGVDVRRTLRPILERAAPPLIAAGRLWLTTLYLDDRPAACTLQFPHPAGPQLYNCGFDPAARPWSPGVVLTAEIIRAAIESGAPTFDLLRGQELYKYDWGATDHPLWALRLRGGA